MKRWLVFRLPRPGYGRSQPECIGAVQTAEASDACSAAASLTEQLGTFVAVPCELVSIGGEKPDVTPSGLLVTRQQLEATVAGPEEAEVVHDD